MQVIVQLQRQGPFDARAASEPPRTAFLTVAAAVFTIAAAITIVWCASMSSMGGMSMPGGWTMSMTWMRMPGQSWLEAAASFLGMWIVMMVAMMLPSLAPMLARYRRAVATTGGARLGVATALAGAGYFFAWTVVGMAIYPLGIALAYLEMQVPAVSAAAAVAAGVVVLIAGAIQLSDWKRRALTCCRGADHPVAAADVRTAWRHGLHLGVHCGRCCANLMAILLIAGVMDLRAMGLVTLAMTAERLGPAPERVAKGIGGVIVAVGVVLVARSLI